MTPDEPIPPHNLAAEEHVLGAMMLTPTAINAVQPILKPADFWRGTHGLIYHAALEIHAAGNPVDAITVSSHLQRDHLLEQVGGIERVTEIATLVTAASNAAHHAGIVAELARYRTIITSADRIARAGWDRDADTAQQLAREIAAGLDEQRTTDIHIETWHEFESQAHDHIPVLIEGLWPEAAFGFIAAPPKKGKTWVALALSIAVATGRPLFDHYEIPEPRPVLYVALEGHRAALRARVGAIARGMNIDPDSDELTNLHFLYKPRGINLSDPAWAQRLRRAADKPDAALITIDVLRAAARLKENDQQEFIALRHNLQPISDDGRSLAMLHHFTKLSEISKERAPGERMSGSGAMFGALDVGIYITGSDDHATKLRLEFDLRDLATPDHINVHLEGEGTAPNGGYGYRDTATFNIHADEEGPDEEDLKAPPSEIAAYVDGNGGDIQAKYVRAYFGISDHTLTRRLTRLGQIGIIYLPGRGKPARLVRRIEEETIPEQTILTPESDPNRYELAPKSEHPEDFVPRNFAAQQSQKAPNPNRYEVEALRTSKNGDLQGNHEVRSSELPTGVAHARTREATPGADDDEPGLTADDEPGITHPTPGGEP